MQDKIILLVVLLKKVEGMSKREGSKFVRTRKKLWKPHKVQTAKHFLHHMLLVAQMERLVKSPFMRQAAISD